MKFVVDTNILYTFFWKKSLTHRILLRQYLELFSPEFALEEINSHKQDILKKTKLSENEFKELKTDIAIAVEFFPIEKYRDLFESAKKISPDPNDIDFFALALKLDLPIWSNDSLLKKQNAVNVFSTLDLLKKTEFADIFFPED